MDFDPSDPDPPIVPDQRGKRLVRDVSWSSKVRLPFPVVWLVSIGIFFLDRNL
jgi:hypothetical protein